MRALALAAALSLASCSDPYMNADVRLTPNGVAVQPSAGVAVGNIGVSVSGR